MVAGSNVAPAAVAREAMSSLLSARPSQGATSTTSAPVPTDQWLNTLFSAAAAGGAGASRVSPAWTIWVESVAPVTAPADVAETKATRARTWASAPTMA